MWLDDGLAFQKVKGKVFLSMDLTLSLTLLNSNSGDKYLGHCNHQLTFLPVLPPCALRAPFYLLDWMLLNSN